MAAFEIEVHLDIDEIIEILKQQEWRPVKHGRWTKLGDDMECSCCWGIVEILNYNYCPYCGAKMDEVEE